MADFKLSELKSWRQRFGLTQKELADVAGLSLMTIGQWEAGKTPGRSDTLAKLTRAMASVEKRGRSAESVVEPSPDTELTLDSSLSQGSQEAQLKLNNLDLELINRLLKMSPRAKLEILKTMV